MRIVIADCTVDYVGRLSAHLPRATRLIMVKADGCVSVHSDGGAYKPLNWMNAPNSLSIGESEWVVVNPKNERLTITIHATISDSEHDLGVDPGLQKDGVEAHLQVLLAERPWVIEEGMTLIRREFPTDIGPVDLLCTDQNGETVAVEIKRRGEIDGVEQLARYVERLNLDSRLTPVRGIFVAQAVTQQARTLAAARGVDTLEVDYDGLREIESNELTLF